MTYVEYFAGEKNQSLVFVAAGLLGILAATLFLVRTGNSFYRGIAYPFLLIGIIEVIVGSTVFFRSPADVARMASYNGNREKLEKIELPRMKKVLVSFSRIKTVEIGLLVASILVFAFFRHHAFVKGVAIGLAVQTLVALSLDIVAEARAKSYVNGLERSIARD